jgi:hypothetical protein
MLWLASSLACAPGGLVLEVEGDSFAPGDQVTLRLHNQSFDSVEYNLCSAQLQRRDEAEWVRVPRRPDNEVCPAIAYVLGIGTGDRYFGRIPSDASVGEHRFVAGVRRAAEQIEVVSAPFQVRAP